VTFVIPVSLVAEYQQVLTGFKLQPYSSPFGRLTESLDSRIIGCMPNSLDDTVGVAKIQTPKHQLSNKCPQVLTNLGKWQKFEGKPVRR
jgi:hypothetical protein